MKEVVFITVEYNNPADTEIFLRSVDRLNGRAFCDVIVVDNSTASPDREPTGPSTDFFVQRLRPPTNLYYWGGAAFALRSSFGSSGPWPKWVVVCNNDVEVVTEDFTERLEKLDPDTHPIVAPSIISHSTGRDQNPILETYPGLLKRVKWRLYDLSYPIAKSLLAIHARGTSPRSFAKRSPPNNTQSNNSPPMRRQIYAPHGACMIFSSAFFERGGDLDTQVPLFAEELTIAALAQKLEMPIWYCPDIRISHREHSTTGNNLTRAKYEMERMARRRYYSFGK